MKALAILAVALLSGCATAIAVVDVTASAAIYTGAAVVKGTVAVVDAVTPDLTSEK